MRYRITNLTSADTSQSTDTHSKPAVDIEAVNEAVARAAARGESLYIRPVRPSDATAPADQAEPQVI